MKKTLFVLCLSCLVAGFSFSQSFSNSEYTYFLQDGEIMITEYLGSERNVTIPSEIDGYTVAAIGERAFAGSNIVSIETPYSTYYIAPNAFENCTELKYATFNCTDIALDEDVFLNCPELILNVKKYSTLHIYSELNDIQYNIVVSMDEIVEMLESPIDEAVEIGSFIGVLSMVEELGLQEKDNTVIPAEKETQKTKPIYGWYDNFFIMYLDSLDGRRITLDLALGYDTNNENALDEIRARRFEIKDAIRTYFAFKDSSELTIHHEKTIKIELKDILNSLCSSDIIEDIKFIDFDVM